MDFSKLNILSELSIISSKNDEIIEKYKKYIETLEINYNELVTRLSKLENVVFEKTNVETNINKTTTKKRNREETIRDAYIQRLIHSKKISRKWKKGMSKYLTITYCPASSKKWLWQSHIFDEPNTLFNTKKEAEIFYENILKKYDIPIEYIIRREYNEAKDN